MLIIQLIFNKVDLYPNYLEMQDSEFSQEIRARRNLQ